MTMQDRADAGSTEREQGGAADTRVAQPRSPRVRLTRLRGQFAATFTDSDGKRRRYSLGTSDHKSALAMLDGWSPPQSAKRPSESVYFLRTKCAVGFVKIGIAADPVKRLGEVQVGCPYEVELTAVIAGDADKERELHTRFAADRERGEWFRPSTDLLRFLETLPRWSPPAVPKLPFDPDGLANVMKLFAAAGFSPERYAEMTRETAPATRIPNDART